MVAATILGFLTLYIFNDTNCQEGRTASLPNFVEMAQTAAEIWRFFRFFKMAAVRHLEFVMRVWGPPAKGVWWSVSLCKIWLEWMQ